MSQQPRLRLSVNARLVRVEPAIELFVKDSLNVGCVGGSAKSSPKAARVRSRSSRARPTRSHASRRPLEASREGVRGRDGCRRPSRCDDDFLVRP